MVEVAGIEPAERAVFMGLRRYSPAFSGHACPGRATLDQWCHGFVPAYPRHQLANPTSSEAGALQAFCCGWPSWVHIGTRRALTQAAR